MQIVGLCVGMIRGPLNIILESIMFVCGCCCFCLRILFKKKLCNACNKSDNILLHFIAIVNVCLFGFKSIYYVCPLSYLIGSRRIVNIFYEGVP